MKTDHKTINKSQEDNDIIDTANLSEETVNILTILTKQMNHMINTKITEIMKQKDDKIDKLEQEIVNLKRDHEKFEELSEESVASERKNMILISGSIPSVTEDENCVEIVQELIKSKLNLNIKKDNIASAFRSGKKTADTNQEDRRPIIIKLDERDTKIDMFSASKQVQPKNFYMKEYLTPNRNTILYALRQAKKKHPNKISSCKSIDGKVYAWLPPSDHAVTRSKGKDHRVAVNSFKRLQRFCSDTLGDSVSSFITERSD